MRGNKKGKGEMDFVLVITIALVVLLLIFRPNFISVGSNGIFSFFTNDYARSGLIFILFFILIFSIMLVGVKRVKIFGDGENLNSQGKVFALVFSLIVSIGVFFAGRRSFVEVSNRLLEIVGVYGLAAFAIVIALLTYHLLDFGGDKK